MTKVIFTICSNNYLGQAIVLGNSVKAHHPEAAFLIVLVDQKSSEVDYARIPFEVLPMESFEPRTEELAARYDIIELNTCVKPRVFEYLFRERGVTRAFYLDPDTRVFAPLAEVDAALDHSNVALTPHVLTPIPRDGKSPDEQAFLRFGIYNLGFIGLQNSEETLALVRWWKERTYEAGYINLEAGMFVDQLWTNYLPIYFSGVSVLRDVAYNMAPWNLHERFLKRENGVFLVNDNRPLALFHFSSFRVDSGELPTRHYSRYSMKERPDLVELYAEYNEELKAAGHAQYSHVRWAYRPVIVPGRLDLLRKRARRTVGRGVIWAVQRLPSSFRERAYLIFRDTRK